MLKESRVKESEGYFAGIDHLLVEFLCPSLTKEVLKIPRM